MDDHSRLYLTRVVHRRLFPVKYRFSYRVFSLLLDLACLDENARRLRLLSVDRFNLLSFHRRDHGPRDGASLRDWAEQLLCSRGIDLEGGKILLLCFPRLLGYGFNPLSIWYCHHRDGSLRALICEVNNTFGEHHFYLLHEQGSAMPWPARAELDKCFHVSPLIGMQGRYRFRLDKPEDRLAVTIEEYGWPAGFPIEFRGLYSESPEVALRTHNYYAVYFGNRLSTHYKFFLPLHEIRQFQRATSGKGPREDPVPDAAHGDPA